MNQHEIRVWYFVGQYAAKPRQRGEVSNIYRPNGRAMNCPTTNQNLLKPVRLKTAPTILTKWELINLTYEVVFFKNLPFVRDPYAPKGKQ